MVRTLKFLLKHRLAFTLVELLAVVAVVCILAAILLPVVQALRQSADKSASVSNLRAIGAATGTYLSDNQGAYPFPYNKNPIHAALNTYLPFADNPATPWVPGKHWRSPSRDRIYRNKVPAYGMNVAIGGLGERANSWKMRDSPLRLSNVTKPSALILVIEGGWRGKAGEYGIDKGKDELSWSSTVPLNWETWVFGPPWNTLPRPSLRNRLSALAVMCDGHVESFSAQQLTNVELWLPN